MGIVGDHYRYTNDLLALESQQPNFPPTWCTCGSSPLKLDLLGTYLHCHPDAQFAAYLSHGLSHGFHIGFSRASSSLRCTTRNHLSSQDKPSVVTDQLREELRLN